MSYGKINITELIYSWHATSGCVHFKDRAEITEAVQNPIATWPGHRGGQHGPCHHFAGPHILVLLSGDGRTIITIKLRTATPYVHGVHTRWNMPGTAAGLPWVG